MVKLQNKIRTSEAKNLKKYSKEYLAAIEKRQGHGESLTMEEAYQLFSSVQATLMIPGVMAEVGVYKGGSAAILCEAKEDRALYLFDTFTGMPMNEVSANADTWARKTHQDTSVESVQAFLSEYSNVEIIPGIFPMSIPETLKSMSFSFVNLDVDLYKSTLEALKFFWPRMSPGGRLISHNYNSVCYDIDDTPGVKEAFKEYFKDRLYLIVEVAETQCLVVKCSTDG
ncbi:MAG: hypothetical protein A3F11_08220 [Gammaproteobacteria bacterium RIFCSPHIGHO2_12_FULL_37_14]|nr:MAG: hypothetical protein A3F11_08220 [Gammaproteobacteria bacterium RIFCSPHIGHO2_12_FULL_37_14]